LRLKKTATQPELNRKSVALSKRDGFFYVLICHCCTELER
jgi:hypothetical protein